MAGCLCTSEIGHLLQLICLWQGDLTYSCPNRISRIPISDASAPASGVACKVFMGARDWRELNFIDIYGTALMSASLTEFCDTFLTWLVPLLRLPCGLLGLLLLGKHTAAKCPFLLHDEQIFSRAGQVSCPLGGHIMLPHLVQAGLIWSERVCTY